MSAYALADFNPEYNTVEYFIVTNMTTYLYLSVILCHISVTALSV